MPSMISVRYFSGRECDFSLQVAVELLATAVAVELLVMLEVLAGEGLPLRKKKRHLYYPG